MKHSLLLVAALAISGSLAAQPTLNHSNLSPVAGEKFYQYTCATSGVTNGASGAGVTWNFSGLTTLYTDSLEYIACMSTPYCDTFPGSTLAVDHGGGYYEYYITDADQFAVSGYGDAPYSEYYSDPISLLNYPMTYGTTSIDTYAYSQPSAPYYSNGVDTFHGDAWGTLILPSGTFPNTLRVHLRLSVHDSDLSGGSPAVITDNYNDLYFWYTPGFHNPLLMMYYDTSGTGTPTLQDVLYYTAPASLKTNNSIVAQENAEVYPNPVSDLLHIRYNAPVAQTITVSLTDMAGRVVGSSLTKDVSTGANELTYPVNTLPAGMYIMKLQTPANTIVKKIMVQK